MSAESKSKKEIRGLLNPAPEAAEPQPLICLDEAGTIPWPSIREDFEELRRLGIVRLMFRDVMLQGRDAEGRVTQEMVARYFYTRDGELEEINRLDETKHLSRTEIIAGMLGLVELPDAPEDVEPPLTK